MANRITSAVLLAVCFGVLIMVCAAAGESQRAVPLNKQGMRAVHKVRGAKGLKVTKGTRAVAKPAKEMPPIAKKMKVTKGMRPIPRLLRDMPPIAKNMKVVTKGMRPIPKVVKEMPPMPPMPAMPPMPDMPPMPMPPMPMPPMKA